jgi:hypothetical protein
MTLEEAIKHASEKAQCSEGSCSQEHRQLAEWLTELRDRRSEEDLAVFPDEVAEILTESECLLADGFEGALIGYAQQFNNVMALYDRDKCIEILVERDGMTYEIADEYFEFNTAGAWVGEKTPAFARLLPHGFSMITALEGVLSSSSEEGSESGSISGN